jgi:hypothetical protein
MWFDEALRRDDPRPSASALQAVAQQINFLAERPGGCRDVLQEERAELFIKLWRDAESLRATYSACLELHSPSDSIHDFADVDRLLEMKGVSQIAYAPGAPERGRRETFWHTYGHAVALLIETAMKAAGYRRSLRRTNCTSVTAEVGAAVISHLFEIKVTASAFATAMRRRKRGQCLPISQWAARLRPIGGDLRPRRIAG